MSDDKRCATCRHWVDVRHRNGARKCGRVAPGGWDVSNYRTGRPFELAVLARYDGAELVTLPDFGCALHEATEGGAA